jgi:uncharacterized repeat protein (TIGR03803 family)
MTHHVSTIRSVIVSVTAILVAVSALALDSEKVLHTFSGGRDGAIGGSQLIADSAGNLYGTTLSGGNKSTGCEGYTGVVGCGVVFKLTPGAHGSWKETVLYTFTGGKDGAHPVGGVTLDSAGNLYGTTRNGGVGVGVVFRLTPRAHGPWAESVLYTFTGDGELPFSGVILDSSGNLYGTAPQGGKHGSGVVFKLTPRAHGPWAQTVLYDFTGITDGNSPFGGLTFDSGGNLYGVTYVGGDTSVNCYGNTGCGVVFKLTPARSGAWTETVLHAFTGGADGAVPLLGVILDSRGNVYGTTLFGGDTAANNCLGGDGFGVPAGCGVVFKLTPRAHGTWAETVLHAFTDGRDGAFSGDPLVFDLSGNLYGMAGNGGDLTAPCIFGIEKSLGCGVVFKLTPRAHGPWTETVLHTFSGGTDGGLPESNLILDSSGNLFGVTEGGGNTSECTGNEEGESGCGVVFEIEQQNRDRSDDD